MPRSRTTLAQEMRFIQVSFERLGKSFAKLAPLIKAEAGQKSHKRSITITPARRAALKLQGQYMGLMRGLKPMQKKKVKKVKETKGIRSAIAAAKRFRR